MTISFGMIPDLTTYFRDLLPDVTVDVANPNFWIAVLGSLISSGAAALYVRSILRGESRPQRVTWWVWAVSAVVVAASYLASAEEVQWALFLPVSYAVETVIIALLAIRYGTGGWSRFDLLCIGTAIASLGVWYVTASPFLAVLMNLVVDGAGAVPTVAKVVRDPGGEQSAAWLLTATGALLTLMAIEERTAMALVYPTYVFLSNGLVGVLTLPRPAFALGRTVPWLAPEAVRVPARR